MAFQRGDVVLIPFPFTDLTTTKTRPAVVISSAVYQHSRPDLLLAYVSSQISKATVPIDYILADWQAAGLLKPSFVRPKIAADEVDRRLRNAMALTASALADVAQELDFGKQSPAVVQTVAEKSVAAVVEFAEASDPSVDVESIHKLLQ